MELVRSLGVEFRQAEVGSAVSIEDLEREFAFVFLGMGLGAMERLDIPGEGAAGVIDALRFIERYKTSHDFPVGRRVIVIGGGNTAIDAANAAKRLGAEEVHVFYRRTAKEMPAFSFEYEHSKMEGVSFHWLAQPVEIVVHYDRAVAVRFVETRLGEPGRDGRRRVEPLAGAKYEIPCDMVIPALGQKRLMADLLSQRGIEIHDGTIGVDRPTGRTANPRYFAGGDCVNGGRCLLYTSRAPLEVGAAGARRGKWVFRGRHQSRGRGGAVEHRRVLRVELLLRSARPDGGAGVAR